MNADRQGNAGDGPDGGDERAFLAAYDPREFPAIAVTVDILALTLCAGVLHVLLVERGGPPSGTSRRPMSTSTARQRSSHTIGRTRPS